jgi:hypothetical protein
VHASWLNQAEIYFSTVQRKVLTPNDFPDLDALESDCSRSVAATSRSPPRSNGSSRAPTSIASPTGSSYPRLKPPDQIRRRTSEPKHLAGPTHPGYAPESRLVDGYPTGIAFDRAGDMFVSSFPVLLERSASGRVLYLGDGFRGGGGPGLLASSPDGRVYAALGDLGLVLRVLRPRPVPNGEVMSKTGMQTVVPPRSLRSPVVGSR